MKSGTFKKKVINMCVKFYKNFIKTHKSSSSQ